MARAHPSPAPSPRRALARRADERGASLILALVFILAISLIVIPLADWASTSLTNTNNFKKATDVNYALSSAVNTAIEAIRQNPMPQSPILNVRGYGVQAVGACWTGATPNQVQVNGLSVDVSCQTTVNLTNAAETRKVTVDACVSTYAQLSQCLAQTATPQLQAVVAFDDYPAGGAATLQNQCNVAYPTANPPPCGFSQNLLAWDWAGQSS